MAPARRREGRELCYQHYRPASVNNIVSKTKNENTVYSINKAISIFFWETEREI